MPFTKEQRKKYDAGRRGSRNVAPRVRGTRPRYSKEHIKNQGGISQRAFCAIDSEGGSYGEEKFYTNDDDKKIYYKEHKTFLWAALQDGPQQKYAELTTKNNGGYLTSDEILEFLSELPYLLPNSIFVAYGFNYDVVQAIKDLPEEKLWELQNGMPYEQKDNKKYVKSPYYTVSYKNWKLFYIKGKKFSVTKKGEKKKTCCIFDVISFFQSSFIVACGGMPVSTEDMETIREGKAGRQSFTSDDVDYCRRYTSAELRALNIVMNELRKGAQEENLFPRAWHGPGALASRAMLNEGVRDHYWPMEQEQEKAPDYQKWAFHAYFGGHVENTKIGVANEKLYGLDIRSAYPAGLVTLPSMKNGKWIYHEKVTEEQVKTMCAFSMIHIRTLCECNINIAPLPYRMKSGMIRYPTQTNGYYFAEEARAALDYVDCPEMKRKAFEVLLLDAWEFIPDLSQPKPFEYIQRYYDKRALIDSSNSRNKILKLVINSTYGKTAQKVGMTVPKDACIWYAGATTAHTRAQLLRVVMQYPNDTIAMMTDGIVGRKPYDVPLSRKLGEWEKEEHDSAIFVRSGIYSLRNGDKYITKTRGIRTGNLSYSKDHLLNVIIPQAWERGDTEIELPYKTYVTLGQALSSKKIFPALGCWVEGTRVLDIFKLGVKRSNPKKGNFHLGLQDTFPLNTFDYDHDFMEDGVKLSWPSKPDWYLTEYGELSEEEETQDTIALVRTGG